MQKTYYPKPGDVTPEWYVVDAEGQTLGRLASSVASLILGKGKAHYTPGVDVGDFVIIINAEKIAVTGNKLDQKNYYRHSGYPGGLTTISLRDQLGKHPERVLRAAVWGMVPHNRHGRKVIKKLKIYAGPEHPHEAQQPKAMAL
ncbi:MAG: 50S ribosomal protein L13 [Anaerolineales bacterium]|nr:50S ribosomal protein L13 [Anaerolineales bacterium]